MKASIINLFIFIAACHASAFTFILGASEKSCFYVFTKSPNTPIGYYFAVQSGGSFDVDYSISNPKREVIVSEQKVRQGEFVFTGDAVGEYEFCFSNDMSTYAEKIIDFEIKFENEADNLNGDFKASLPELPNVRPLNHVQNMQGTIDKIDQQLDGLLRTLQYYKTRNNRNQATVQSTELRIYFFSILEVVLMVAMGFLQITIVQLFFKGSRKQLV